MQKPAGIQRRIRAAGWLGDGRDVRYPSVMPPEPGIPLAVIPVKAGMFPAVIYGQAVLYAARGQEARSRPARRRPACMNAGGRCGASTGRAASGTGRRTRPKGVPGFKPMVGEPAEPFLKAEDLAPAHPGQNHQADYRLAASAADWQAYCPNSRRVPRHRCFGRLSNRSRMLKRAGLSRLKDLEPAEPARRSAACFPTPLYPGSVFGKLSGSAELTERPASLQASSPTRKRTAPLPI